MKYIPQEIENHALIAIEKRLTNVEEKYVIALYWADVAATTGTITAPSSGTIVANYFAGGVDALTSKRDVDGFPTFVTAQDSLANPISATLGLNGAYTLSAVPVPAPCAILYYYRIAFKDFDTNKSITWEFDFTVSAPLVLTGSDISIPSATAVRDGYLKKEDFQIFAAGGSSTASNSFKDPVANLAALPTTGNSDGTFKRNDCRKLLRGRS